MEGFAMLWLCFGVWLLASCDAVDTLATTETMRDADGDAILSADGMFELGFFSLGNSNNRYLGIRYSKVSNGTVVWVANRDAPLNTTSAIFQLRSDGILQLLSHGDTIWSSSIVSSKNIIAPVAQLLDNGNLVVRDENSTDQQTFLWQSFDYPGDTFLPGMKLGKDLVSGIDRRWISWTSLDDPSPGRFIAWMDTNGFPQIFVSRGSVLHTRFGPWNGLRFSGMPSLRVNPTSVNEFVFNEKEVYYGYEVNSSIISRMYMNPEGGVTRMNWVDRTQSWSPILMSILIDSCSTYGLCGPYGTCNTDTFPVCSCMGGFEPKRPDEWNVADWSSGCVRRTRLDCGSGDGFRRTSGVKLPDTRHSWYNVSMSLGECETACRMNCSCTAYANLDIRNGGSGCLLWFDELMDVREYDETQNVYVRMAVSDLTSLTTRESGSDKKKQIIIAVVSTTSVCLVLVGLSLAMYARSKKKRSMKRQDESRSSMLDWPQRFSILHGIARGLLYLHQDSRLRVIHRDLKAGNILLDHDMNPKISDFGLARRFKGYETEANTNKVVGTYGYISPEYAVHGLFSIKSDVFSFGVLVLEIVSGKKNRGFSHEQHNDNLLGHAWRLYQEGRSLELASSQLRDMCIDSELLRSIHIGLLCVQHHAEDRPTMSSVVVMLDNESKLPPPKQPAFFTGVSLPEDNAAPTQISIDDGTITLLDAR